MKKYKGGVFLKNTTFFIKTEPKPHSSFISGVEGKQQRLTLCKHKYALRYGCW